MDAKDRVVVVKYALNFNFTILDDGYSKYGIWTYILLFARCVGNLHQGSLKDANLIYILKQVIFL